MGCDIFSVDEFLNEKLLRKGPCHSGYYHYTRWGNLASMLSANADKRFLWMSRADCTNDGIESMWGRNVYMLCFSYSRYEDVAMWMNYGKRHADAIRIRFDGQDVREWWSRLSADPSSYIHPLGEDGDVLRGERLSIISVNLGDVAYVLPSRLLIRGLQEGNVDYTRTYYSVKKDGSETWADNVFDNRPIQGVSPFFKKRGWGYEREVRLIVTLPKELPGVKRLAVDFSVPLDRLEERMRSNGETSVLFPELMSSPWYEDGKCHYQKICGIGIDKIARSDYQREIKMFG